MIARRTNEALRERTPSHPDRFRTAVPCTRCQRMWLHVISCRTPHRDPCRPRLPTSLFSWHSNINVAHPFPAHTPAHSADAHRHCTLPPAQEHPAQYSERPVPPPQEQSRASGAIAPSSRRGRGGKGSTNGIAWRWSSRCRAPCTSPKLLPLGAARRLLAAARARDRRHTHTHERARRGHRTSAPSVCALGATHLSSPVPKEKVTPGVRARSPTSEEMARYVP